MSCDCSQKLLECFCRGSSTELCPHQVIYHGPSKCGERPSQLLRLPEGYEKLKYIGKGKSSRCYLAKCLPNRRLVVKVSETSQQQKVIERAKAEVGLYRSLSHVNIVKLVDITSNSDSHLCIVTNYAPGGNLKDKLKTKRTETDVVNWCYQISGSLQYLHNQSIPIVGFGSSNVLFGQADNVKISVFNLNLLTRDNDYLGRVKQESAYFKKLSSVIRKINTDKESRNFISQGIRKFCSELDSEVFDSILSIRKRLKSLKENLLDHEEVVNCLKKLKKDCENSTKAIMNRSSSLIKRIKTIRDSQLNSVSQVESQLEAFIQSDFSSSDSAFRKHFKNIPSEKAAVQNYVTSKIKLPELPDIFELFKQEEVAKEPDLSELAGKLLFTCSEDRTIGIWDLKTTQRIQLISETLSAITAIAVSKDKQSVVSASKDKTLGIWDTKTGSKLLTILTGSNCWINSVDIHGEIIVAGLWNSTVVVFNSKVGNKIMTLRGHIESVNCVKISESGSFVASGGKDASIQIWELSNGTHTRALKGHKASVNSVRISKTENFLVSGSSDNTVGVWELYEGTQIYSLEGHVSNVLSVVIFDNCELIASASKDSIRVWNLKSGELVKELSGISGSITCIAATEDMKYLVSSDAEGSCKLTDLRSFSTIKTLNLHSECINEVEVTSS